MAQEYDSRQSVKDVQGDVRQPAKLRAWIYRMRRSVCKEIVGTLLRGKPGEHTDSISKTLPELLFRGDNHRDIRTAFVLCIQARNACEKSRRLHFHA